MGIVTDKLVYGALSWTALDKNANDRGIKDTHTSDDVGILWAADTIATQQARIERLETDNAKFIQANIMGNSSMIIKKFKIDPNLKHQIISVPSGSQILTIESKGLDEKNRVYVYAICPPIERNDEIRISIFEHGERIKPPEDENVLGAFLSDFYIHYGIHKNSKKLFVFYRWQ